MNIANKLFPVDDHIEVVALRRTEVEQETMEDEKEARDDGEGRSCNFGPVDVANTPDNCLNKYLYKY